jgi:hypothetical protein
MDGCSDVSLAVITPPTANAHERLFAAAVKLAAAAAAAEFFLALRTDGERYAAFSRFPHYVSVRYGFCRVDCCVRSFAKKQTNFMREPISRTV